MKLGQICREEMKPIINIIVSVLAGMLLITTIWKNDYTQDIPFGILNQDNSVLAESIVQQFQINPTLDVSYYADSEADLKQAILDNKIEAGVMIPRDFGKNVTLQKSPQAIIFADCSNIITGGGAMGAASTVLGTLSAGIEMQMLEGSSFVPVSAESSLGTFSYVERVLYEPQGDYIRKMSYLLAATICMQIFFMSYYIPLLLRKRKELAEAKREDWKGIIKDGVARALVVGAGCVLAQIISLLVIAMYKNLPMRGTLWLTLLGSTLFTLASLSFGLVLGSFTRKLAHFTQCYLMCSNLVVFTSGIIFPFYLMPKWFALSIRIFSPVPNIAPALKAINLKGVGLDAVWPQFAGTICYTLFWLIVGGALYCWSVKRERKRLQKAEG